jgi:hypothetical protein
VDGVVWNCKFFPRSQGGKTNYNPGNNGPIPKEHRSEIIASIWLGYSYDMAWIWTGLD